MLKKVAKGLAIPVSVAVGGYFGWRLREAYEMYSDITKETVELPKIPKSSRGSRQTDINRMDGRALFSTGSHPKRVGLTLSPMEATKVFQFIQDSFNNENEHETLYDFLKGDVDSGLIEEERMVEILLEMEKRKKDPMVAGVPSDLKVFPLGIEKLEELKEESGFKWSLEEELEELDDDE